MNIYVICSKERSTKIKIVFVYFVLHTLVSGLEDQQLFKLFLKILLC